MFSKGFLKLCKGPKTLKWYFMGRNSSRSFATGDSIGAESHGESEREVINGITMPPEPTCCCHSGCPNCVWIKYAQELAHMFDDGDLIAKKKIAEKVQDPKLKAYLLTQLAIGEDEKS